MLGLKLEAVRAPADVLVVDKVEAFGELGTLIRLLLRKSEHLSG